MTAGSRYALQRPDTLARARRSLQAESSCALSKRRVPHSRSPDLASRGFLAFCHRLVDDVRPLPCAIHYPKPFLHSLAAAASLGTWVTWVP